METHLQLPLKIFENLDLVWSWFLVVTRYTAMMTLIPGIGQGQRGLRIRMPAILVMAYASSIQGPWAPVPEDWITLAAGVFSEVVFGMLLGMIPLLIIAGVQTAAQLSATTMGLGAGQLMDPNLGVSVPSLGRVFSDVVIVMFLMTGGHHTVIYIAAGMGGQIVPGSYLMTEASINMLIARSGDVFLMGAMLSAPVIVALLLTQFVMGLISKAVPTVNIFIVSFPLTIGIGLVLAVLSFPELMVYTKAEFERSEQGLAVVAGETRRVEAGQHFDARVSAPTTQ